MREEGVEYLKLDGEVTLARPSKAQLPQLPEQEPPRPSPDAEEEGARRHPLLVSHRRQLGLE